MFSCILGMEDETALSIIDPVMLNIEINKDRILEVSIFKKIESPCLIFLYLGTITVLNY